MGRLIKYIYKIKKNLCCSQQVHAVPFCLRVLYVHIVLIWIKCRNSSVSGFFAKKLEFDSVSLFYFAICWIGTEQFLWLQKLNNAQHARNARKFCALRRKKVIFQTIDETQCFFTPSITTLKRKPTLANENVLNTPEEFF